jgi:CheY-like chemotaxis protein
MAGIRPLAYDVLLLDMQMHELDGLEATRRIRLELPENTQPYIIAMTANAMQGDREICLAAGMDEYVSKPIRIESLVSALSKGRPLNSGSSKPEPALEAHAQDVSELDRAAVHNLLEVLGGEFRYLVEVIDSFLEDGPKLLAELEDAVSNGDIATVRRLAHSLKSNSADFGAGELNKLCAQLEERARSGSLDGAPELATRIGAHYQGVAAQLVELKKRGSID